MSWSPAVEALWRLMGDGWTHQMIADEVGVSRSYVTRWVRRFQVPVGYQAAVVDLLSPLLDRAAKEEVCWSGPLFDVWEARLEAACPKAGDHRTTCMEAHE